MKALRSLDRWFFGYGSPVTMGLFRILFAGLAVVNLLMVALYFNSWYTQSGYSPMEVTRLYAGDDWRINPLRNVAETPWIAAFYAAVVVAGILTTIGLWTRVSSILFAIGVVSLHHRNLLILHGGDTLMRVGLIYVALAPSGAACSVDRLLALWRGKAQVPHRAVPLLGQRLVQFNIALLYLTTVWHKRGGTFWFDGTATWYPAHLPEFHRFWVPEALENSLWFVQLTTYGTLAVELALATLVFYRPFRKWVLLAGLAMHAFIEYRFNIPLFAFITTSTYVCFYEGGEVAAWARRFGARLSRFRVRVELPKGQVLAPDPRRALEAADPMGWVEYGEGTAETWTATNARGEAVDPFKASLQRSLGVVPFAGLLVWGRWRAWLEGATRAPEGRSEPSPTATVARA
ncbi:MAG: HTTM domain-containing protein [Fimbriimonadaceae bacterium]|nr:HTTM domain-containing protein [Chthonomonadaceae bacterium]MCO5295546.1 HTTM domain-containing protein [Fimbriimonadaceae bacterium]